MNRSETRTWSTRALISLVGVAALAVGCGGGQSETQTADAPPPPPPAETAVTPPPAPPPPTDAAQATTTTTTTPEAETTPAAPPLTDEQIAAVSDAANTAEIDTSKVAQTKAKDARVKKFAAMMIQHHTDAKKKQTQLVTKLKMTPAESPVVTKMKGDVDTGLSTLKTATGADFDRAYIDLQVKLHQDTLDALDKQLLPNAKNADLKALLTELRPTVESHLTQAKELQTSLGSAGGTGTGTGGTGTGGSGTGGSGKAGAGAGATGGTGTGATGTGTGGTGTGTGGTGTGGTGTTPKK